MKKSASYSDAIANVDSLLSQVLGTPMGKSASERDAADGSTSHPTGSAPDGTQDPVEGPRTKENDADVNAAIDNNVNQSPAHVEGSPDSASTAGQEIDRVGENVPPTQNTAQDTDAGTSSPLDVSTEKTAQFAAGSLDRMAKQVGIAKAATAIGDNMLNYMDNVLGKGKSAGAAPAKSQQEYELGQQFGEQIKEAAAKMAYVKASQYAKEGVDDARLYATFVVGAVKQAKAKRAEEGMPPEPGAEGLPPEMMGEIPPEMAAEGGMGEPLPPEDVGALLDIAGGGEGGGLPPEGGDPALLDDAAVAGEASNDELAAALMSALEAAGITPEELPELAMASEPEGMPLPEKAARLKQWENAAVAANYYANRAKLKRASVNTSTRRFIKLASDYLRDLETMKKRASVRRAPKPAPARVAPKK